MRLKNTTDINLTLPNGTPLPANGEAAVPQSQWEVMRRSDTVKAWLNAAAVVEVEDEPAQPEPKRTKRQTKEPAGE